MVLPPVSHRREIDRNLADYFRNHRIGSFRRAIAQFCRFYNIKLPRIEWYEYLDWGKTAGRTFEDGRVHLIHPENWKRCRIYKSERMWVNTVYHEMGHYLFWSDPERKADTFQRRMVRGLKIGRAVRPQGRTIVVSTKVRAVAVRRGSARSSRRPAARVKRFPRRRTRQRFG